MGIKLFVVRFHQKTCIFVVISIFVCSLSQSIIDYACPNFQATSEWHLIMSLSCQWFLQFHPKVLLVAYVNSCFIIIRQNFFPVSVSLRIS